jgi:hypothetical protein
VASALFPRLNWRVFVVLGLCFAAVPSVKAQITLAADENKQLATLRTNLSDWQKTLASMDFTTTGLDARWVDRLNQERDMCLQTIKSASVVSVTLIKDPTLTRDFVLTDSLTRLQAELGSLLDFVNLSYWSFPPGSGNQAVAMKFQQQISPMLSGTENTWESLQYELVNRLNAIDKGGSAQAKGPVATQR